MTSSSPATGRRSCAGATRPRAPRGSSRPSLSGRGAFVVQDSYQPRRAQPDRHRQKAIPFDAPPAAPRALAGPDCRVCAASVRVVDESAHPVADVARSLLGGLRWFYLKWDLGPKLDKTAFVVPADWRDARVKADPDADGRAGKG